MASVTCFIRLSFQLLLFSQNAQLVPVFISQPSNPSTVLEGQNLTLHWSYNLDGQSNENTRISNVTGGSGKTVVSRTGSSDAIVKAGYENQFIASISDTEAILTILAVPRSGSGEKYRLFIFATDDILTSDIVEISVLFKPENVQLITNITANNTCPGGYWNFTCSVGAANPQVTSYQLLENDTAVDTSSSGMWIRKLSNSGEFTYKCLANNTVGSTISANEKKITVAESASVVRIVHSSDTVIEGNSFNVTCKARGDPKLIVYWIKEDTDQRFNGSVLNFTSINRNDNGTYRCEVENDCGSDSRVEIINVSHPPNITYISENMTVNQSESVNLTCRADGNPKPNITWTKDGTIINSPFTVRGKRDEGLYVCTAYNSIGNASKSVFIAVEYFGPFNTSFTALAKNPKIVYLNTSFNLSCSAQASPPASYRFYRGQESLGNMSVDNTFETSVVQITCQVTYACTPFNHFGDGPTKEIQVEVYYPPVGTFNETIEVFVGSVVDIRCHVVGNPLPNITWYKGDTVSGIRLDRREKEWITTAEANETYLCIAKNLLGTATARVDVVVVETENVTMKITLTISGMDCSDFTEELKESFRNETLQLLKPFGVTDVVINIRCGSVIVDLELSFTQSATVDQVVETLKRAASQNNFGGFTVDPESIRETGQAVSTIGVPTETLCQESFIKKADCSVNVVIVAVLVVVAVVVVAFVAGVIGWWIHKRRKCRKDPRIHHSESEVLHDQNDIEDGAYARVNGGYADSGPPSANGTAQPKEAGSSNTDVPAEQAAAAPPAYAVVDKSKKKDKDKKNIPDYAVVDKSKKKKKKPDVEDPYAEVEDPKKDKDHKTADPSTHDYAMVDKSKKKKKETDENAYATVDKSKKSKKGQQKPKAPGEVLYADLGDFQPVQPLPTVSTSPEPLAPVKRPTPYQGTEYADITQFLKGNATLPEGQSTEMQPTYANAGGGQGAAANKENANTGGEGGGGDTEPKETPM